MSRRRFGWSGRSLALLNAVLLIALSVGVPALDSLEPDVGPVVESEHDPSACLDGHDHSVCTQFGANRALSSARPHPEQASAAHDNIPAWKRPEHPGTRPHATYLTRAPPHA